MSAQSARHRVEILVYALINDGYPHAGPTTMYPLHSFAAIKITGPDARSYLQGQLSNDLDALTPAHSMLASCNSSQGRVQAVLHWVERDDGLVAILPRVLMDATLVRLRKYVLRAKLTIEDQRDSMQISWLDRSDLEAKAWPIPTQAGEHVQHNQRSILRWPDALAERWLTLQPGTVEAQNQGADHDWLLADIRAGLPQVLPETHESFVAQMLNLDVLNGINFNKGCYTGQEIIARAHFRGTVKRRMFRFQTESEAPVPGTRVLANGEHAGEVVMAASILLGCELLAVVSLAQGTAALTLENSSTPLMHLPLPYEVTTA
jgi:folate-binding protein YgfZ